MVHDQSELALQTRLCALLSEKRQAEIAISDCTDENVHNLGNLLQHHEFSIAPEDKTKKWKLFPDAGVEIVGGAATRPYNPQFQNW